MRIDKESQLIAIQLFGSESFLTLNKRLLKMFGPNLTVFTCNLIDKYKYFLNHGMINADGSFFLTFENQAEDTGMTKCELRACKRKLIEMRVLKTLMKSVPAKEFYFLNIEILLEKFLTPRDKESLRLEVIKPYGLPLENLTTIKDKKFNNNKDKENKDSRKNSFAERVISFWNIVAEENQLASVLKPTPSRISKITSRSKSPDLSKLSGWRNLFSKVSESSFLLGNNESNSKWKVSFDWLVENDKNYIKVLEGVYADNKKKPRTRKGGAVMEEGKYDDVVYTRWDTETGKKYKMRGETVLEEVE